MLKVNTMMMFRLVLLSALIGCANAHFLHSKTLPESRDTTPRTTPRLLEDDGYSWMSGYSLKYENCFANDGVATFRLCPEDDSCKSGCSGGASYSVDFLFFVDAFTEAQLGAREYACEMTRENCDDDDEDTCYANAGLDYCIDNDDEDEFDIQEYLECAQFDDGDYYVGPFCSSEDAYSIYLGLYTDEYCSVLADEGTFYELYGYELPYSSTSIIETECARCREHALDQDQNEGDQEDEDDVIEQCEELYEGSAKCEEEIDVEYADTSGCSYIEQLEEDEPAIAASTKAGSSGSRAKKLTLLFVGLAIAILACCGLFYFCYPMYKKEKEPADETEATAPGYKLI